MATIAYLDIDQGSDFSVEIGLENDDGSVMNLYGFQVYSQFRKSYGSVIAYNFTASFKDNGALGVVVLNLSGIQSSNIRPGRYLYDIEIYNPETNVKTRVVEGIITLNAEITRIP